MATAPAVEDTDLWETPVAAPRQRTRRRRGRGVRRVLGIIFLLLIATFVVVGIVLWARVVSFNDRVSTSSAYSSALLFPLMGSDRVNVVMLGYAGVDTGHGGELLTDSINILSIDPETDTTTVIPIPRDLWIEGLEQLPGNGKVNEVFAAGHRAGGLEEAGRAVSGVLTTVTGLDIHHWMSIDFTSFREMVDAVGGVTITNPTAFAYTWSEQKFQAGVWDGGRFEAGVLELDGQQALDYARTRYASVRSEASDFARSIRQQRIMSALRSKLGEGGMSSMGPGLQLMDALEGRLQTDLSAIDLFLLSGHLGADRRIELSEDVVLRATTNTIGQYILIPIGWTGPGDYGGVRAHIAEQLARPIETPDVSPSAP